MNAKYPKLTGIRLLFAGLAPNDRSLALSTLANELYLPHIGALPDPFAVIPTDATPEQVEAIGRGMLATLASNLSTGDHATMLYGDDEDQGGLLLLGDDETMPAKCVTTTLALPIPELSAVLTLRRHMAGTIDPSLVGVLNFSEPSAVPNDVDEDIPVTIGGEGDYQLEGGFLSKLKQVASTVQKVAGPAAKLASKVASSPIGKVLMKGAKLIPGVGNVLSAIELGTALIPQAGAKSTTSPVSTTPPIVANNTALTVSSVFSNPDKLEAELERTFGKQALVNAMFRVLANEGDLVDDIESGLVDQGPALLEGDWKETALNYLNSATESFSNAGDKIRTAGSKTYEKLRPKVEQAWTSPWGKAAAGAAGAGILYAGAAKIMKDRERKAQEKIIAAKREQLKKLQEDNAYRAKLLSERAKLNAGRSATQSGGSGVLPPPALPPLPPVPNLPVSEASVPTLGTVERSFLKVPFAGNVFTVMEDRGKDLLKDWTQSLLKVNPMFLSGDLCTGDMEVFGTNFILHGFPISTVSILPQTALDTYLDEVKAGRPITSPALTRSILQAAMDATSGKPVPYVILTRRLPSTDWCQLDMSNPSIIRLHDDKGNAIQVIPVNGTSSISQIVPHPVPELSPASRSTVNPAAAQRIETVVKAITPQAIISNSPAPPPPSKPIAPVAPSKPSTSTRILRGAALANPVGVTVLGAKAGSKIIKSLIKKKR